MRTIRNNTSERGMRPHRATYTTAGAGNIRFTDLVRDTIAAHGLRWAVTYYARRLSPIELRIFLRVAYCA